MGESPGSWSLFLLCKVGDWYHRPPRDGLQRRKTGKDVVNDQMPFAWVGLSLGLPPPSHLEVKCWWRGGEEIPACSRTT